MRILIEKARTWTIQLLEASGLPAADARLAADIFIRASLGAQGHHDISYLPQRLGLLADGLMKPKAAFELIGSGGAWEAYDGGGMLGEVCVSRILERAMKLASTQGIGFSTVRHSNHFLAAAPYAGIAAEGGYLCIVWSNTDPCMGDPEAQERVIGNNPYGFGLPLEGANMVYDACMAYASLGKLAEKMKAGHSVPASWGRDAQGRWSEDPQAILKGGIPAPIAGHKGFSQAILHEALSAGLAGGEIFDEVLPVGGWGKHSQSVLALKLSDFPGGQGFRGRFRAGFERMRARLPCLRFAGERSLACAQNAADQGIEIQEKTFRDLSQWSSRLGVQMPSGIAAN